MVQRETVEVRGNVGLLALGICVGLLVGLTLAPRSGADVRRLLSHLVHDAPTLWGLTGRISEELAEDLSS
jgi:hypothetical protein